MNKYMIWNDTYKGIIIEAQNYDLILYSIVFYNAEGHTTYIFPAATTTVDRQ